VIDSAGHESSKGGLAEGVTRRFAEVEWRNTFHYSALRATRPGWHWAVSILGFSIVGVLWDYLATIWRSKTMVIPSTIELSSDILAAATTLAGLVLVFLATEVARYLGTPGLLRDKDTRSKYRRRAQFVFVGFVLTVASALLALFGKWFQYEPLVFAAAVAFVLSALLAVVAAFRMVGEIKK
jgi:energy-converting hydrogenase Eha subunit A